MKDKFIFLALMAMMIISGCSQKRDAVESSEPKAADKPIFAQMDTIRKLYDAAYNGDEKTFLSIAGTWELAASNPQQAMKDIVKDVYQENGKLKDLGYFEVENSHIDREKELSLIEKYGNDWLVVAESRGENDFAWIMQGKAGKYIVLDGIDDFTQIIGLEDQEQGAQETKDVAAVSKDEIVSDEKIEMESNEDTVKKDYKDTLGPAEERGAENMINKETADPKFDSLQLKLDIEEYDSKDELYVESSNKEMFSTLVGRYYLHITFEDGTKDKLLISLPDEGLAPESSDRQLAHTAEKKVKDYSFENIDVVAKSEKDFALQVHLHNEAIRAIYKDATLADSVFNKRANELVYFGPEISIGAMQETLRNRLIALGGWDKIEDVLLLRIFSEELPKDAKKSIEEYFELAGVDPENTAIVKDKVKGEAPLYWLVGPSGDSYTMYKVLNVYDAGQGAFLTNL